MPAKSGDAFLAPIRHDVDAHLWIVLAGPDENGKVLVVNVTSYQARKDTTVTLVAGDHPFVTKKSVINYAEARMAKVSALDIASKNGDIKFQAPVSSKVLETVRVGLLKSGHTPEKMVLYLKQYLTQ